MAQKTIDYYDKPDFDYRSFWENRQYEDQAERVVLTRLFSLIKNKKAKSLIDIGAGFGRLVPVYAPLFKSCLLVEPSEKLLAEAKRINKNYDNLTFKESYVEKLPVEKESFEVVLMVRVAHHLEDLEEMIKEVRRVLKPKGFFIMEYANKKHLKNFLEAFFKRDWQDFASHGPEKIKTRPVSFPFFNYHPNQIRTLLFSHDFEILKRLSVSNFRSPLLKKILPLKFLTFLDRIVSPIASYYRWGPSIFVLSQKK
jgi:ubiquinone/menaquinone biosynthesis C-methylase UbiE